MQNKVIYKAQLYYGIAPVKVDPLYTSKTCPVCGHVSPDNRPDNGEHSMCWNCGYSEHADVVGAINIALREFVKDQNMNLKGLLVDQPDVPLLG